MENDRKVNQFEYFADFADRIGDVKSRLSSILTSLKKEGKTIAGYGAAAKAATMMAYMDIGKDTLDFVADKNEFKHGKYFSGNHLPIRSPDELLKSEPDYILILAWNFAQEIMAEQKEFKDRGGNFLIPIPDPHVV